MMAWMPARLVALKLHHSAYRVSQEDQRNDIGLAKHTQEDGFGGII